MTFSQSIRTCVREKYFTFSGRASRSEYWWFFLFYMMLLAVPGILIAISAVNTASQMQSGATTGFEFSAIYAVFGIFLAIVFLGLIIPVIAVAVRRFHDVGLSGWWYLAAIIVGMVPMVGWLASIASLVVTVLKGQSGPNRFGPDPLAPGSADIFA